MPRRRGASMTTHGFVRVAAAAPRLRVAACDYNARRIHEILLQCTAQDVQVVVFPELSLTGYTCGDLFHQPALQSAAAEALDSLILQTKGLYHGLAVVGLPVLVHDQLFNCAAVFHDGLLIGLVPKSY